MEYPETISEEEIVEDVAMEVLYRYIVETIEARELAGRKEQ